MSSSPAPITFNGSSTYSSAFQQVITRAVSIASLPLQSLQQSVSTLTTQQSTLSTIGADFSALQTAIQALGSATGGSPNGAGVEHIRPDSHGWCGRSPRDLHDSGGQSRNFNYNIERRRADGNRPYFSGHQRVVLVHA